MNYEPFLAATGMPLSEVARRFLPIVGASFAVALVATPICRRIALRTAIVDRPDDFLKPHGKPIPYLGGVAIFLGWAAGLATAILSGLEVRIPVMLGIAAAGLAIMLIGLFDDLRVMRPKVKLAFNIAVALFLLWLGIGDKLVNVATDFMNVKFEPHERWLELAYSVPVSLLIIVGACNATNLIDGMDGLCAGVLGIISLGFLVLAANLRFSGDVSNERMILALAMLGAAAGFLPFNVNPAKIFLGDAGSMLLGLNAAILILLFGEAMIIKWMIGALMVFGLPVADMLLAMARRWRNGKPLMAGDRSHFYDQLRDRGFSVKQVVAISYVLTAAFVLVGLSVLYLRTRYAVLVYCLASGLVLAGIWKFDMVSIEGDRLKTGRAGKSSKDSEVSA
jgi:UDP-GlcNAc:undecaprenyl-phosphate/decaprenyl-phosphate GlcNAc-1-phosphate transferase